jgi:hypothetical protein
MQRRLGFARLLPLMVLSGLAAGTFALLASALPVQAPRQPPTVITVNPRGIPLGDCRGAYSPAPAHGIVDADGRCWELADIPGHTLRGLDVHGAQWSLADLHNTKFVECDLHNCDLRRANLRGVVFIDCNLANASFNGADAPGCVAWWTKPIFHGENQWSWM